MLMFQNGISNQILGIVSWARARNMFAEWLWKTSGTWTEPLRTVQHHRNSPPPPPHPTEHITSFLNTCWTHIFKPSFWRGNKLLGQPWASGLNLQKSRIITRLKEFFTITFLKRMILPNFASEGNVCDQTQTFLTGGGDAHLRREMGWAQLQNGAHTPRTKRDYA